MSIYRGAGGAGDAVADSSSEALLVRELAIEVQADADAAAASATDASGSASNAATSATNAANSATAAASSATSAASSASSATTSKNAAATSATAAASSATAAASSATSAAGSATTATTQATNASNSASAASTSATNASNSATAAATSATNASNSATAAATSATNAASSATSAAGSASTATTQASNASTSATNAASSATSASGSATTATTQAGIATTKAGEAATSASNAASSASAASTSASNAATSETNAASSASTASSAASAALASLDSFDDRYLGAKSSEPTLDNDGNALASGALYFNTVSNTMKVYTGSVWVDAYADGAMFLTKANPSYTGTLTGGTGVVNLGSGQFYKDASGNVGIGIASPASKLDVRSDSVDSIFWGNAAASIRGIATFSGSTVVLGSGTVSPVVFAINSIEKMRIDSSGNVGIGTSSPQTKLQLATTVNSTASTLLRLSNSGSGSGVGSKINIGADTGQDNTTIGIAGFYDGTGTAFTVSTTAAYGSGSQAERMRIDSSGNVGIGTSTIVRKLDVRNTSADYQLHLGDTASTTLGYELGRENTGGLFKFYGNQTGATGYIFSGVDGERMRIDASGNVGIGTASPATKLNLGGASDQTLQINGSGTAAYVGTSTAVAQISSNRNPTTGAIYDSGRAVSYINLEASSGNGNIQFYTTATNNVNATERMRIDSSGNVGIGTSSPNSPAGSTQTTLHISNATAGTSPGIHLTNGDTGTAAGNGTLMFVGNAAGTGVTSFNIYNQQSSPICFFTGTAERMRIDSSGNLLVGTTSQFGTAKVSIQPATSSDGISVKSNGGGSGTGYAYTSTTTTGYAGYFSTSSGVAGNIYCNGTGTTYATSSDYRLKENIAPMTGALDVVQQLKPVTYNWKADGSSGQGFIAHELQAVVPDCVTGEKDAVDEEGNPKYQGIDTSFLVATLTKAIQELKAELDVVKAELNTLKGN